ncbi:MAG: AmmeMemoRadiSam system protein B [Candidatus Aminicenantes bacterium]|nr:AmmeMemoRadiSam system protein B [Candidatus Aminicenantes bacterium]
MIRSMAVAGQFYPADKGTLEKELKKMVPAGEKPQKVIGLLAPHAGYMYSGTCAGQVFGRVTLSETVIILGVNHRGYGADLALDGNDFWETPLGNVAVDSDLRSRLLDASKLFTIDSEASRLEHSLEVQVPFVKYCNPESRILPITIAAHRLADLLAAGEVLAGLFRENTNVMMVASSDMSHYIPAANAKELDSKAIEPMLKLDARELYRTVQENRISMCGVAPAVIMLAAAREAGATGAELVCYTNSGEVSGDFNEVVGYAGLIVY